MLCSIDQAGGHGIIVFYGSKLGSAPITRYVCWYVKERVSLQLFLSVAYVLSCYLDAVVF